MSNCNCAEADKSKRNSHPISPLILFLRFLKIGVIGFGGGSALIPVIEQELVGDGKPMLEEEYLKHTVIANITPGALPVKLGATCGYQLGGPVGSLAGAYGVMFPGVFITIFIMALFSMMGPQMITMFHYASVGISAFIVMLLMNYVLKTCNQESCFVNWGLCGLSFMLTCGKEARQLLSQLLEVPYENFPVPLFDISTIDLMIVTFLTIIVACARPKRIELVTSIILVGTYCVAKGSFAKQMGIEWLGNTTLILFCLLLLMKLLSRISKQRKRRRSFAIKLQPSLVLCIALFIAVPIVLYLGFVIALRINCLQFLGNIVLSTVTSFGGGEAYVSVADGFFVQNGYISADVYYTKLVPVANALPGPILIKIASGVGFIFGSDLSGNVARWGLAAVAAVLSTGVCCSIALVVLQMYAAIEQSVFIAHLKKYILPVICGMLISTSCSMFYEAAKILADKRVSSVFSVLVMAFWVVLLRKIEKKYHVHDIFLLLGSATVSFGALMLI